MRGYFQIEHEKVSKWYHFASYRMSTNKQISGPEVTLNPPTLNHLPLHVVILPSWKPVQNTAKWCKHRNQDQRKSNKVTFKKCIKYIEQIKWSIALIKHWVKKVKMYKEVAKTPKEHIIRLHNISGIVMFVTKKLFSSLRKTSTSSQARGQLTSSFQVQSLQKEFTKFIKHEALKFCTD